MSTFDDATTRTSDKKIFSALVLSLLKPMTCSDKFFYFKETEGSFGLSVFLDRTSQFQADAHLRFGCITAKTRTGKPEMLKTAAHMVCLAHNSQTQGFPS